MQILPVINCSTVLCAQKKLEALKGFSPRVSRVHIDVGEKPVSRTRIPFFSALYARYARTAMFEVHYMVHEKKFFSQTHASAGVTRIFYPYEHIYNRAAFEQGVRAFRKQKIDVGVAIPSSLSVRTLILPHGVRSVLILAVSPGPAGQKFHTRAYKLIAFLKKQYPRVILTVDGGITPVLVRALARRGVSRVTSSAYIWEHKNPSSAYQALIRSSIE